MSAKNVPFNGSSPRMRGALTILIITQNPIGIIPADAGSTLSCLYVYAFCWDHPRGCGEHKAVLLGADWTKGSSPRMRGALVLMCICGKRTRIIPADAGSTYADVTTFHIRQDHPRGCGEHERLIEILAISRGSSPRMRGARTAD